MKKLIFGLMVLFLATIVSASSLPPAHFVDGNQISNGANITTGNSFTYTVRLFNGVSGGRDYYMLEGISSQLTLTNSNYPYTVVSSGSAYDQYGFDITIPEGTPSVDVEMTFRNDTSTTQESASINTSFCNSVIGGCFEDLHFFIFKATVPAIPEFGFFLIPVGVVLGSFFLVQKKKQLAK
jgi:hypothetical protein